MGIWKIAKKFFRVSHKKNYLMTFDFSTCWSLKMLFLNLKKEMQLLLIWFQLWFHIAWGSKYLHQINGRFWNIFQRFSFKMQIDYKTCTMYVLSHTLLLISNQCRNKIYKFELGWVMCKIVHIKLEKRSGTLKFDFDDNFLPKKSSKIRCIDVDVVGIIGKLGHVMDLNGFSFLPLLSRYPTQHQTTHYRPGNIYSSHRWSQRDDAITREKC